MRANRKFNHLNVLCRTFGALASLLALTGCPDTKLKACYQSDECGAGQVCSADGRCAMAGGGSDLGLDAGADMGHPSGLDLRNCRVVEGPLNPALSLRTEPTSFTLVSTRPDRVVRVVAQSPVYNEGLTEQLEPGTVRLYCSAPDRIDLVNANQVMALGTNNGMDGGRPAVRMLLAGGQLHVGWWQVIARHDNYTERAVEGVSMALDADGCPVEAGRVGWSQAANAYAYDFDLAWLDGRLHLVLGRPPGDVGFWSNWILPAIDEADNVGSSTFDATANHVAVVSQPSGAIVDVFASATPNNPEILLHGRMAYDRGALLPVDARGDYSAVDLGQGVLLDAEAGPEGRIGVLRRAARLEPNPPCGSGQMDGDDTNNVPQSLVFQLVEPGLGSDESVYVTEAIPSGATGDPLFADLTWHSTLRHFAVAYNTVHGNQGEPERSGIRLALLNPEDGTVPTVDGRVMDLQIAHYDQTCQTVADRPQVVPTAEGFLVIWFHRYSHLRHARVVCTPPP